jgi:hypothetical protein
LSGLKTPIPSRLPSVVAAVSLLKVKSWWVLMPSALGDLGFDFFDSRGRETRAAPFRES